MAQTVAVRFRYAALRLESFMGFSVDTDWQFGVRATDKQVAALAQSILDNRMKACWKPRLQPVGPAAILTYELARVLDAAKSETGEDFITKARFDSWKIMADTETVRVARRIFRRLGLRKP